MGDRDRFRPQETPPPAVPSQVKRDWQNWHTWDVECIRRLVNEERQLPQRVSVRYQLARLLSWLGSNMLDVGCPSGAMWVDLERYR